MSSRILSPTQLYLLLRDNASNRTCKQALFEVGEVQLDPQYRSVIIDFVRRHPTLSVQVTAMRVLAKKFPYDSQTITALFSSATSYNARLRNKAVEVLRELLLQVKSLSPDRALPLRWRYAQHQLPFLLSHLENAGIYHHYQTWRSRRATRRYKKSWEPVTHFVRDLVLFLGEHAVPPLFRHVVSQPGARSQWAARMLGRVGGSALEELVGEAFSHWENGSGRLQDSMVYLLGHVGPGAREALPHLLSKYEEYRSHGLTSRMGMLLKTIARIGREDPEIVAYLCKELIHIQSLSRDHNSHLSCPHLWLERTYLTRMVLEAIAALGACGRAAIPLLIAFYPKARTSLRKFIFSVLESLGYENATLRSKVAVSILSHKHWDAGTVLEELLHHRILPGTSLIREGLSLWVGYRSLLEATLDGSDATFQQSLTLSGLEHLPSFCFESWQPGLQSIQRVMERMDDFSSAEKRSFQDVWEESLFEGQ